tara:strand:+ start:414 stop:2219 length:1806 start_codon:yes stop_codon:yes gene_type:complete
MFQNIKKIYKLLSPDQRKKLVFLQILVIFMSFTEVIGVLAIGPFMSLVGDIDQIHSNNLISQIYSYTGFNSETDFIIFAAFMVIAVLTFAAVVNIFTIWKISMYAAHVGATLSNRLFVFYVQQPWLFHATGNSSELLNKIVQESSRLNALVINPIMQFNARFVMGSIMLVAMTIYNPPVAISAIFIFLLAYYILFLAARGRLNKNGEIISNRQADRFKVMSEAFGGIKDTLVLGRQASFISRFISASDEMAVAMGISNSLTLYPKYLLELLAYAGVVSLVLYLIFTSNGQIESIIPVLAIFALAGFKVLPAFQLCYSSLSVIKANMSSFETLEDDLLNSSQSLENQTWKDFSKIKALTPMAGISVNHISFAYPDTQKNILNDINIQINVGQFIGIVGSSGSGKSTLIDIILGLIEPMSGEVRVDEIPLTPDNLRAWQSSIGVVSQDIFLADSSIRENVAFGLPLEEINEEKVQLGVGLANLHEFIKTLPDGLDTRVGERGIQLSGGQKQRIGIARALYNNASTLIFDEATSALDGITEKKVMDAIYSLTGSKTIIVVAHRLASVKKCDAIYLLDDGKVIDSGVYDDLSSKNSLFKEMTDLA